MGRYDDPTLTIQPYTATVGNGPALTSATMATTATPIPPAPALNLPPPPVIGPAPAIPTAGQIGKAPTAPTIGPAPTMKPQAQQAISGEVFNRILPSIKQYEATTGRSITPQALRAMSESEFQTAADRAAQNKQLAIQEYQTELQKYSTESNIQLQQANQDLQRYGMDTNNLFQGAQMALTKYGMNADIATKQYAQQLQAAGMEADQAYKYADMAMRQTLAEQQNQTQRDIAAGNNQTSRDISTANNQTQREIADTYAKNAGIGQLIGLGGFLVGQSGLIPAATQQLFPSLFPPAAGAAAPGVVGVGGAGAAAPALGGTASTDPALVNLPGGATTAGAPAAAAPAAPAFGAATPAVAAGAGIISADAFNQAQHGNNTRAFIENPFTAQFGALSRSLGIGGVDNKKGKNRTENRFNYLGEQIANAPDVASLQALKGKMNEGGGDSWLGHDLLNDLGPQAVDQFNKYIDSKIADLQAKGQAGSNGSAWADQIWAGM